jgi:hypothetical protein
MPTYFLPCPLLSIYVSELGEETGFEIPRKWYDLHDGRIFNSFVGIRWYSVKDADLEIDGSPRGIKVEECFGETGFTGNAIRSVA